MIRSLFFCKSVSVNRDMGLDFLIRSVIRGGVISKLLDTFFCFRTRNLVSLSKVCSKYTTSIIDLVA